MMTTRKRLLALAGAHTKHGSYLVGGDPEPCTGGDEDDYGIGNAILKEGGCYVFLPTSAFEQGLQGGWSLYKSYYRKVKKIVSTNASEGETRYDDVVPIVCEYQPLPRHGILMWWGGVYPRGVGA